MPRAKTLKSPKPTKLPIDFTMGADPEFCFVNKSNGEAVEGARLVNSSDKFGVDGNGWTFEIRPDPSKDPLEIVRNIHKIFRDKVIAEPKFLEYGWQAGSFYDEFPIGGHIHFGTGSAISAKTACGYLSNYVGAISLLIENASDGRKRRKDGYGGMYDYRDCDYGFEYRAPSSWITSPYIAAAMLCLAKTVMAEVLNNPKFKFSQYVNEIDFFEGNVDKIRPLFPQMWQEITEMQLYQQYKPYLDILYYLVTKKLTWFPKNAMHEAWGLVDMREIWKKQFNLDVVWARYKALNSGSTIIEPAPALQLSSSVVLA